MEEWSRFWRQGHTTTFGDYFDNGYAGPVKAWLDTLADPIAGADEPINIAELCCGNGSLLPFLFSLEKTFHYTGVDAAEVQLPEVLHASVEQAEGSVQLLGNTPAETLPETVRDITSCLSIYGMEYSALGDTLAGLLPRMRSGGHLFALMHHHDSVVAKMSARAVSEYDEADIAAIKKALTTIHETLVKTGSVAALKADEEAEAARKFMNGMGNKYVRGATMETGNAFMADHVLAALRFFKLIGQPTEMRAQFIDELRRKPPRQEHGINRCSRWRKRARRWTSSLKKCVQWAGTTYTSSRSPTRTISSDGHLPPLPDPAVLWPVKPERECSIFHGVL